MLYVKGEYKGKQITVICSVSDNGMTTSFAYIDENGILCFDECVLDSIVTDGEVKF